MRSLLVATLLLLALPAQAQDLLKPGDTISGKLRLVKTAHPSGTVIKAYQIVSDHPRKFAKADDFCGDDPPRTFHLVTMDDKAKAAKLKELLGRKITVVLDDFFCSETAWHIGDAVSFAWHFVNAAIVPAKAGTQ
jgi:thymidylate kinase